MEGRFEPLVPCTGITCQDADEATKVEPGSKCQFCRMKERKRKRDNTRRR